MEKLTISINMEKEFEWDKWRLEIPFINFPRNWEIKIIPPFSGAVIRFIVKRKDSTVSNTISVYLDCYDVLGCYNKPYWEIYPYDNDVFRCDMNDVETLIKAIKHALK